MMGILNELKSLGIINELPSLEKVCFEPNLLENV
jgi:hypothetical protein